MFSSLKAFRKNSFEEVKRLIAAKYPIIWIESWEEERVESMLKKVATTGFNQPLTFQTWSETRGLGDGNQPTVVELVVLKLEVRGPDADDLVVRVRIAKAHHRGAD